MEAYKPKHALNFQFEAWELLSYLISLMQLFAGYFIINNYMIDISPSWLGFALAFVNFTRLGRIFGIKEPSRTVFKARTAIQGPAQDLANALTSTICSETSFDKDLGGKPTE